MKLYFFLLFIITFSTLSFGQVDNYNDGLESVRADILPVAEAFTLAFPSKTGLEAIRNFENSSIITIGCRDIVKLNSIFNNKLSPNVVIDRNKFDLKSLVSIGLDEELERKLREGENLLASFDGELSAIVNGVTNSLAQKTGAIESLCSNQSQDIKLSLVAGFSQKLSKIAKIGSAHETETPVGSKLLSEFAQSCGFSKSDISIKGIKVPGVIENFEVSVAGHKIKIEEVLSGDPKLIKSALSDNSTAVKVFDIYGKIKESSVGKLDTKEILSESISSLGFAPKLDKELSAGALDLKLLADTNSQEATASFAPGFLNNTTTATFISTGSEQVLHVTSNAGVSKTLFDPRGGKFEFSGNVDVSSVKVIGDSNSKFKSIGDVGVKYSLDKKINVGVSYRNTSVINNGPNEKIITVSDFEGQIPAFEGAPLQPANGFSINAGLNLNLANVTGELRVKSEVSGQKEAVFDFTGARGQRGVVTSVGYTKGLFDKSVGIQLAKMITRPDGSMSAKFYVAAKQPLNGSSASQLSAPLGRDEFYGRNNKPNFSAGFQIPLGN